MVVSVQTPQMASCANVQEIIMEAFARVGLYSSSNVHVTHSSEN